MAIPLRAAPLLVLLLLVVPSAGEEKAPDPPGSWYAQTLTRGGAGLSVTHFWSKGPMLRAETVVVGHKIVTIVRGEWYYAYDALSGEGVAIRREPGAVAADRAGKRPFGREYEILLEQGAELVREEELLGRRAGVYRITDEYGRRELWVTEDALRIPLRLEIFERGSAERRVTDYINWQSDLQISDDYFSPARREKLVEMDYREYLRRSAAEGSVGPVPVFYMDLVYKRTEE